MRRRALLLYLPAVLAAGLTLAGAGTAVATTAIETGCKAGTTSATVAGKRVCLKTGQRCERKLDRQYHRFGFHCHTGRLAKSEPPRPPTPPVPPTLPGQLVDVGGYRLYLECTGSGTPTIVFEGGQGGAAASAPLAGARAVRDAVATESRVCSYDRAGIGASEARPAGLAPTGARYADELNALLTAAGVPGPYVLVGPSYGGLVVAAYATRYPAKAAGLVFVDSTEPCTCTFDLPERGEFDLAGAAFGSLPVLVLAAEWGTEGDGRNLALRSTNSMLVTALQTTHAIIAERPELVTAAVRLVATAVRNGTSLGPCAQSALPAAGGRCETVG